MADDINDTIEQLKSLGLLANVQASDTSLPSPSAQTAGEPLDPYGIQPQVPQLNPPGMTLPTLNLPGIGSPTVNPNATIASSNPKPSSSPSLQDITNSASGRDLRKPTDPYSNNPNEGLVIPKFGDVDAASGQLNDTLANEGDAYKQAATDKLLAEKDRGQRLTAANDQYVNDLAKADIQHQFDRESAHKVAAAETASWMQAMDKKAAEEPSPGRWWENENGFGKAMWLLSLAFGAIGASKSPGVRNVALDMMTQEMDNDINRQKDRLNKQMETLKLKGQTMTEGQKMKLTDLQDDYSHKVGRLNALFAANTVRANTASNADAKAVYSQVEAELNKQKADVAIKRVDRTTQERLKQVEEVHADRRQATTEFHQNKRQELTIKHQEHEGELNRKKDYDLAEERINAKLAVADAKAQKKGEMYDFPQQSGVSIQTKDETGNPVIKNLSVPKEMLRPAHEIVSNGQKKIVTLAALKDAIESDGLPYTLFSNSNQSRQALAAAVDPQIKQMGGRFNAATAKSLTDMLLGEDPTNLVQRMKGGSKEDIVALLDKEIREAPGAIKQDLLSIPGTNLGDDPGANLSFTPQETRGPKEHVQTSDEKISNATGQAPEPVILKTKEDVKNFGEAAHEALPSELKSIVDSAKDKLEQGHTKDRVYDIYNSAQKAIEAWTVAHPDPKATGNINARALLNDAEEKAKKIADKLPEVKADLIATGIYNKHVDITDIEKELKTRNMVLSAAEMQKMVNDINNALSIRK